MNLAGISDALRPMAGQQFDLLIVLDTGSSMEIWQPEVVRLRSVLSRKGGFRTVRTAQMNCTTAVLESGGPVGRQVVLVVTDTVAPGWISGAVCRVLAKWARVMPVAVVNVLPQRLWSWGGLSPDRVRVSRADQRRWLPVLALDPEWWVGWVAMLVYGRPMLTTAVPIRPEMPVLVDPEDGPVVLTARERMLRFRTAASVEAFQLAGLLAAVPLTIPIMRRVRAEMLPKADDSILAEVFLGRLLQRTTGPVTFDFVAGIRKELLADQRRADTVRVVRVLGEEPTSPQLRNFRDAIDEPNVVDVPDATVANLPHLRTQLATFRALSGRYAARARRLLEAIQIAGSGGGTVSGPPAVTQPARAPASRPRIWGAVPLRNPDFVGREGVLEELRKRLTEPGATAVLPEALHGMGGVGKSQTVIEYIYRHAGDYDLVWWISSEQVSMITSSFVDLARQLDVPSGSADVAIPAVLDVLRRGQPVGRWLLVFDNADRPDVVSTFFPVSGHIIVTSRNAEWVGVARTVEVNVFTRDESIEFLRRRGGDLSLEDADRLAEALGDLPLAIEQAAAWHALTGMPIDEMLRLIEKHLPDLLGDGSAGGAEQGTYRPSVVALWNASLDRLSREHVEALRLLQACAFFGPEPIPRRLFVGVRDAAIPEVLAETLNDSIKLNRALRELSRLSLVKIDHRSNTIHVHRLIQSVVKSKLSQTEQDDMFHAVHVLLGSGDPAGPGTPQNWPRYAELLPHVTDSGVARCRRPDVWGRRLMINMVRYLVNRGDFDTAQQMARTALEVWKTAIGPTHADTLLMARHLADALRRLDRLTDAQAVSDETYELVISTFGEDSELALSVADTRTADLRSLGQFGKELLMQQDLLERARRILGWDDPETLRYANNLASCLRLNGKFQEALDVDTDTLARKEVILGEDHPGTFLSHNALAMDLRECGQWLEACEKQEETLDRQRVVLGEDNPGTIGAIRNLAVARRMAGQHEGARELSQLCVDRYRRRRGDRHVDTITAEMCLSADLRRLEDLAESEKIGRRSHELFVETHGVAHPYTLICANNLGITLRLLNSGHDAYQIDSETFAQFRRIFGDDHPFTLVSATNTASDLAVLGEDESARQMDEDTLSRSTRVLGADHPTTLAVALNLSLELRELGREDEAMVLYTKTYNGLRRALGDDHPAIGAAVRSLRANCDTDTMQL